MLSRKKIDKTDKKENKKTIFPTRTHTKNPGKSCKNGKTQRMKLKENCYNNNNNDITEQISRVWYIRKSDVYL